MHLNTYKAYTRTVKYKHLNIGGNMIGERKKDRGISIKIMRIKKKIYS